MDVRPDNNPPGMSSSRPTGVLGPWCSAVAARSLATSRTAATPARRSSSAACTDATSSVLARSSAGYSGPRASDFSRSRPRHFLRWPRAPTRDPNRSHATRKPLESSASRYQRRTLDLRPRARSRLRMGPRTRSRVSALRLVHARASRLDDAGRPRRAQRADDAHAADRHRPSDAARGAPHSSSTEPEYDHQRQRDSENASEQIRTHARHAGPPRREHAGPRVARLAILISRRGSSDSTGGKLSVSKITRQQGTVVSGDAARTTP